MNETKLTKEDFWKKRIQDFQNSGLSRKEWCQENQVPLSTFNYWIRKQMQKPSELDQGLEPVFARLPSTTIYLWLIFLTASKELPILLLKLYNDRAIGISAPF